MAKSSTNVGKS